MTSRHWLAYRLVFVLALTLLVRCRHESEGAIATLTGKSGEVSHDFKAQVGAWAPAEVGATFSIGDGIRTSAASTATLRLFESSTLMLAPHAVLRFRDRAPGRKRPRLELQLGEATVSAGSEDLELDLQSMTAKIEANGQVRLVHGPSSTRLEVVIGSAQLLVEGERLELSVGQAVEIRDQSSTESVVDPAARELSRTDAGSEATTLPAPPRANATSPLADAPSASPADAGGAPEPLALASAKFDPGPALVDLVAAAGDSFVVHDPQPPTLVGFTVPAPCSEGAVVSVEVRSGHARETGGLGRVGAEFAAGSHRYTVACLEASTGRRTKVAEGTIVVLSDAGLRRLPKTAHSNTVDTDGRQYTVLYQGLLPTIAVRWRDAPPASSYVLHVRSGAVTNSLTSPTPSYTFSSGALAEGSHVLEFATTERSSRPTTIAVQFDNAAPTASITSPADRGFAPGASVMVSGSALAGWTVSVRGEVLSQDGQSRFSRELTVPSAERALAIGFTEKRRGVHYYLRRSAR